MLQLQLAYGLEERIGREVVGGPAVAILGLDELRKGGVAAHGQETGIEAGACETGLDRGEFGEVPGIEEPGGLKEARDLSNGFFKESTFERGGAKGLDEFRGWDFTRQRRVGLPGAEHLEV